MNRLLVILALLLAPFLAAAQDQPATPPPGSPAQETPAPAPAQPAPWQGYPVREVDRPILTATDGYLLSIGASSFSAVDRLDEDGSKEALSKSIGVLNIDFNLRYGITDRWEAFAGLPYATAQTSDFSSGGIGNAYAGTRAALIATDRFQLAAGIAVSFPTGESEYHYHLESGEVVLENFRTGNPGVDWMPEIQFRYKADSNLSIRVRALAIVTSKGETLLNAIGGDDEKRDVDPGDGWRLDILGVYQASPRWVIPFGMEYYQLGETELSGMDFNDAQSSLGLRAGLMFQVNPAFEVELTGRTPLTGRNVYLGTPVGLELRTRF